MNASRTSHGNFPDLMRSAVPHLLIAGVLAGGLLVLPLALELSMGMDSGASALAGNGNGNGSGDGDPGNGGSSGSNNGAGGGAGSQPDKGDLYGDMVYVLRDADGVPVLYTGEDSEGKAFSCLQPLAIGRFWHENAWVEWTAEDGQVLPLVAEYPDPAGLDETTELYSFCVSDDTVDTTLRLRTRVHDRIHLMNPLGVTYGKAAAASDEDSEPDACDVIPLCASNVREVELGRLSVVRSPDKVLDRQRDEAVRELLRSYPAVALDHGGRLVLEGATFDSPLINLALMREFLKRGMLGEAIWAPPETNLGFPDFYTPELAAAFGLGAGDDKLGSGLDAEVVIRTFHTLAIPALTEYLALVDTSSIYDPGGLLREYIDLSHFTYDREAVFPGAMCWDQLDGVYTRQAATIINAVFNGQGYTGTGLAAFAQAAEDARTVMVYVHDGLIYYIDPVFQANFDGFYPDPQFCPALATTP